MMIGLMANTNEGMLNLLIKETNKQGKGSGKNIKDQTGKGQCSAN